MEADPQRADPPCHPPKKADPQEGRPSPTPRRKADSPKEENKRIWSMSGQYASYWNAFLFIKENWPGMWAYLCTIPICRYLTTFSEVWLALCSFRSTVLNRVFDFTFWRKQFPIKFPQINLRRRLKYPIFIADSLESANWSTLAFFNLS